jgi:hypothetical protein
LRHEGVTRLFEVGHTISEAAMVPGRLSRKMLQRYTNLKPSTMME